MGTMEEMSCAKDEKMSSNAIMPNELAMIAVGKGDYLETLKWSGGK